MREWRRGYCDSCRAEFTLYRSGKTARCKCGGTITLNLYPASKLPVVGVKAR